jgi:N-acetylneuraminate synthase
MSDKRGNIYVIAEAGVNHNGSRDLAFSLVDAAVEAGADAVKFQTFKAGQLVTRTAQKAAYQQKSTDKSESQLSMLLKLELAHSVHIELAAYCKEKKIDFISTAFDHESLQFLVDDLDIPFLKIASGEITNAPFLLAHAMTGKDVLLSTGMCDLSDIEEALGVLAFGYTEQKPPLRSAFKAAYASTSGQKALRDKVTLLHCTTQYPVAPEDVNLAAIRNLAQTFGLRTGFSDHSKGIVAAIAAAAMGAQVIEKHFTLDRTSEGPDHQASLEPAELKEMIANIRRVQIMMGDGIKRPLNCEIDNRLVARKSIVAACRIEVDEVFTQFNLTIKRPGNGRSPMDYWHLLGSNSPRSYEMDEVIS